MIENENTLYEILEKIGITEYQVFEHQPIYTSKEAEEAGLLMEGLNLKNLLVKDKKSKQFFLVILCADRHLDARHFKKFTGWGQICFAQDDDLKRLLGLTPGAVSPFGLIHDTQKQIVVVLDKAIAQAPDTEFVNFHPNRNTATLRLTKRDFYKFLKHMGNQVILEV